MSQARRTKRSTIIAEAKHSVKEVAARLSQDEDKIITESNARIAIQSIKGQCAALDLRLMKAEWVFQYKGKNYDIAVRK